MPLILSLEQYLAIFILKSKSISQLQLWLFLLKDIISTLLGMLKFEYTKPGLMQKIQLF